MCFGMTLFSLGRIRTKFAGMEELEKHAKWETIYNCLQESGLVLFEPDGIIIDEETGETENVGVECLIDLRTYFVQIEEYRKAAYVHRLIKEYKETWPDAYNREYELLLKPVA